MVGGHGRRAIAAALFVVAIAGCVAGGPIGGERIPTEAEARAVLVELVELARRGDFEALCSYADGNCPHVLAEAGPDRVPADPPAIVGTWTLDPTPSRYGGVVLQVCGLDATGAPYASEILFMRTAGGIRVVQPVYWSGLRIARDGTAGGTPAPGFAGCP